MNRNEAIRAYSIHRHINDNTTKENKDVEQNLGGEEVKDKFKKICGV